MKRPRLAVCATRATRFTVSGALIAASACGGSALEGASIVAPGREPTGKVVAVYAPRGCVDRSGGPASPRPVRLFLVDRAGGLVLVETRPGYDSLVIDNGFAVQGYNVFQASLESSARPILLDYRIAPDASGGKMAVARIWQRAERSHGFRAYFSQVVLACRLVPLASQEARPTASFAR